MSVELVFGALIAGGVVGGSIVYWSQRAKLRQMASELLPADTTHVLELLRRAHGGDVAVLTVSGVDPIVSLADIAPPPSVADRAKELAELARVDRRTRIVREGSVFVVAGDGECGVCLALDPASTDGEGRDVIATDLRRWLSELEVMRLRASTARGQAETASDWYGAGASLDSMAFARCEAVRRETGRSTALAVRDPDTGSTQVVAVSIGSDRRLLGTKVRVDSAVGRACAGDLPVEGTSSKELFGRPRSERRRREERGVAFPLLEGRTSVGAVVVFGPPRTLTAQQRERIMWYAVAAGPRIAGAWEARNAESQVMIDAVTKVASEAGLRRTLEMWTVGECALVVLEIQSFEEIREGFGPQAATAALRHASRVLQGALRDDDVPARIKESMFAAWLPHTPVDHAHLVAQRVQSALTAKVLDWGGVELKVGCHLSVSSCPEDASTAMELLRRALDPASPVGPA